MLLDLYNTTDTLALWTRTSGSTSYECHLKMAGNTIQVEYMCWGHLQTLKTFLGLHIVIGFKKILLPYNDISLPSFLPQPPIPYRYYSDRVVFETLIILLHRRGAPFYKFRCVATMTPTQPHHLMTTSTTPLKYKSIAVPINDTPSSPQSVERTTLPRPLKV